LDLADFKPRGSLVGMDLSERLFQGFILKEKDFRNWLKEHNWDQYKDKSVFIFCSVDAIVPTWAYMLVMSHLLGCCDEVLVGSKSDLEKKIIKQNIRALQSEEYAGARVIIKGCSDVQAPEFAMSELVAYLQPHVKSIMYGEPCSTVPIFKKKKR
jgi:hypothetical protein